MPTSWRTKSGIVMFHLTMPSHNDPVRAMRQATGEFIAELPVIGRPRSIVASTVVGGEHANTWTGELDAARVTFLLEACSDLTRVQVTCDLCCEGADGDVFAIPAGLTFWVQLAENDSRTDDPLEMTLVLDTDIYLAQTWGEDRDNRALAERNAPAFNRFLARLRRSTGAVVESVSADDYQGQVDENGIVLP